MPYQYFDTHCHPLESPSGLRPLNHVKTLSVSIRSADWSKQILLKSEQYSIALGIHPWFVEQESFEVLDEMDALIQQSEVDAIGEIGLDFMGEFNATKERQLAFCEKQLALAEDYHLPVSIHCRKAFDAVYDLLKQYQVTGFMHGFSGSFEQAKRFTHLGMKIGVGSQLLNPNARKASLLAQKLPLNDLVLETDFPFAKNQEGIYQKTVITEISNRLADIKSLSTEEVSQVTYNNAIQILEG